MVKLRPFNGRVLTYPIKIEVGDGTTMTPVWSGTTDWWEKTAQTFAVTDTPGQYVKVSLTGPNSHDNTSFSLYEAEIYVRAKGTDGAGLPPTVVPSLPAEAVCRATRAK